LSKLQKDLDFLYYINEMFTVRVCLVSYHQGWVVFNSCQLIKCHSLH